MSSEHSGVKVTLPGSPAAGILHLTFMAAGGRAASLPRAPRPSAPPRRRPAAAARRGRPPAARAAARGAPRARGCLDPGAAGLARRPARARRAGCGDPPRPHPPLPTASAHAAHCRAPITNTNASNVYAHACILTYLSNARELLWEQNCSQGCVGCLPLCPGGATPAPARARPCPARRRPFLPAHVARRTRTRARALFSPALAPATPPFCRGAAAGGRAGERARGALACSLVQILRERGWGRERSGCSRVRGRRARTP